MDSITYIPIFTTKKINQNIFFEDLSYIFFVFKILRIRDSSSDRAINSTSVHAIKLVAT